MKKTLYAIILLLVLCCALVSCNYKTDDIPQDNTPHNHTYDEWQLINGATCTENGNEVRYCECGEFESRAIPAKGHVETVLPSTAPTCTERGYSTGKSCSVCHEILIEQDEVAPLGHSFGEWVVLDNGEGITDCGIDINYIRSCNNCSETERKTEQAPGHSFGDWKLKENDSGICDCIWNPVWVMSCSNCNATKTKEEAAVGHTFGSWTVKINPTKTTDGLLVKICNNCTCCTVDHTLPSLSQENIDKALYSLSIVEPTCTGYGSETYSYTLDGQEFCWSISIPPLGHKFSGVVCDNCGQKLPSGLYSASNDLLASWDDLVNIYGLNINKVYSVFSSNENYYKTCKSSGYYVLNNYPELANGTKLVIGGEYTTIRSYAFYECESLTHVAIPDTVTIVDDNAFTYCYSLESIIFSKNLQRIGAYAFNLCKAIKEIDIPENVTRIGSSAFSGCSSLAKITISGAIANIDAYAFKGCTSLTGVYIDNVADWCKIKFATHDANPLTFSKLLYLNGELVKELEIPDGVTSIPQYAFNECSKITSVKIPCSVTNIGYQAFYNCNSLVDVYAYDVMSWCKITFGANGGNPLTIAKNLYFDGKLASDIVVPDEITTIKPFAFYNYSGLKSITLPDSLVVIDSHAFYNCSNLGDIVIPDSVTSIGTKAFYGCKSINNVYFGENSMLSTLGEYAFTNCSSLTSIKIPNGVTRIERAVFMYCSSLESIDMHNGITYIGNSAFYSCHSLKSIELPFGITKIENETFNQCKALTSVIIPDSVTTIGGSVFDGCHALKSVVMSKNVTSIGYRAFYACRGLTDIYYSGNETDWSQITISSSGNEVLSSATIHYNYSEKIALICS